MFLRHLRRTLPLTLLMVLTGLRSGYAQGVGGQGGGGVIVDANGVMQMKWFNDPTGQLGRERLNAAKANWDNKVAQKSELRKVSLNRLEKALAADLAKGKPAAMLQNLAGLTRIEYVFFYPDSGDIVVAGPAEAWAEDLAGHRLGVFTGRPILQLEDLAVALRMFSPNNRNNGVVGCSIDPTEEGLKKMQQFLRSFGPRATPNDTDFIVQSLRNTMGMQKVTVMGVPGTTHFAQVLVEADFRMKLIGIGLERPPVKLSSYVDRASPTQVSRNALQRWYFTPDYDCVKVSDDRFAMQMVGQGVKLVSEDELVAANGQRKAAGSGNGPASGFARDFTKVYTELAAKLPIYAQLRNLIDMSIAAAFIREQGYYEKSGFKLGVLADENTYSVQTFHAPTQVETVVTSIWKGNRLMTPLGGGVEIQAMQALSASHVIADKEGTVAKRREEIKLPEGQWWWD